MAVDSLRENSLLYTDCTLHSALSCIINKGPNTDAWINEQKDSSSHPCYRNQLPNAIKKTQTVKGGDVGMCYCYRPQVTHWSLDLTFFLSYPFPHLILLTNKQKQLYWAITHTPYNLLIWNIQFIVFYPIFRACTIIKTISL